MPVELENPFNVSCNFRPQISKGWQLVRRVKEDHGQVRKYEIQIVAVKAQHPFDYAEPYSSHAIILLH